MKIALVGWGQIAHVHVPFILEARKHTIVGVCDAEPENADALGRRFRIRSTYKYFAQLLWERV